MLSAFMLVLCQLALGQSWNPDADGNNLINYNDLLQFLPLYSDKSVRCCCLAQTV